MSSENSQQLSDGLQVTDATLISRSPTVLTAEVDGEVLMMSIERGCYFSLNDVGYDIWRRLDPPCSFAELIDRLAADYDAARATIVEDVQALLSRMVAEDIVRVA
jgi:Coenzyme PQQ synthesis protein D (PqqD)